MKRERVLSLGLLGGHCGDGLLTIWQRSGRATRQTKNDAAIDWTDLSFPMHLSRSQIEIPGLGLGLILSERLQQSFEFANFIPKCLCKSAIAYCLGNRTRQV